MTKVLPDTQKEIISLNFELSRLPTVWQELARFPQLYGPSSRWASRNKRNKQLFLEVQKTIKDQIIYYAKLTHKNAQKDDNLRAYGEAMKGYSLYLASYPKSREVAEVKYLMADINYFAKNYREAGKLYLEICMLGAKRAIIFDAKTGRPASVHKDSCAYMLDAYATDFDKEYRVLLKRKPDFSKPPMALTGRAQNFVKACGYYTKQFPKDAKSVKKCDVEITKLFYHTNNKKLALKYSWMLAKKYPGSKEGTEAAESLIMLYKGDKAGLARAADELLKIPPYSRGKLGSRLKDLRFGVQVDLAQNIKNNCKRAEKFEQLYKKNPKSGDADKLIYNAANDFLSCGKVGDAITSYMIVLKRHPKSVGAKEALLQVAKLNERRLDLQPAAEFYGAYAKNYPKDKLAVGSLAKGLRNKSSPRRERRRFDLPIFCGR